MNKNVITRAPEVHLTFWLVRWIGLFTTKSLNIVPKLKSKQITMFWHFKHVLKKTLENHDFSRPGPPAGQQGQNWPSFISEKSRFFKVGAARRATGTKLTFVYFGKITIFQGRGGLQVLKIWPPDRILEHFLYHSELFWPVCLTGSLRIVRKPQT